MNGYIKTQIHRTSASMFKWYETLQSIQFIFFRVCVCPWIVKVHLIKVHDKLCTCHKLTFKLTFETLNKHSKSSEKRKIEMVNLESK